MHGTASTTHRAIQPQRPTRHQSISVYTIDCDRIETADQGPKLPIGVRKFGLKLPEPQNPARQAKEAVQAGYGQNKDLVHKTFMIAGMIILGILIAVALVALFDLPGVIRTVSGIASAVTANLRGNDPWQLVLASAIGFLIAPEVLYLAIRTLIDVVSAGSDKAARDRIDRRKYLQQL